MEIAFLPLNHSYKLHQEFKLFQIKIKPSWKVDRKIARLSEETIQEYERSPFDAVESLGVFTRWAETLQLRERKKIIPLVWDWAYVKPWLEMWMGQETMDHYISESHREIQSVVNFINDRSDFWGEEVPFKIVQFKQTLTRLNIRMIDKNSVIAKCMGLVDLNSALLRNYIAGFNSR